MKLTKDEKNRIAAAITEVKLNVEHTKNASMLMKANQAEAMADSIVSCLEIMAGALGVDCE